MQTEISQYQLSDGLKENFIQTSWSPVDESYYNNPLRFPVAKSARHLFLNHMFQSACGARGKVSHQCHQSHQIHQASSSGDNKYLQWGMSRNF